MSSPTHLFINRAKRVLFGPPKRTDQQHIERLSVAAGLAVFSSDGFSSVAYATEEILYVLMAAGTMASVYSLPIGLGIVALVLIVATSYTQTIRAYPSGGGSYVVSRENLGTAASLIAGAALLIDYVLTVAVSAAAGIDALISAIPALHGHQVALGLLAIWLIALVNLRGVRESGAVFSVPTYGFLLSIFLLLTVGLFRVLTGDWHPAVDWRVGFGMGEAALPQLAGGVSLFMILRAFSSGCTALTGLEAVSNGVQAFRPPEEKHAIRVMNLERTLLYVMFGGITLLAFGFNALPREGETVLSQIAREVLGGGSVLYYVVQSATVAILLLAANTAYADFPRLTSLVARDGFLPRKLATRGDQLVFNYGILVLAGLASTLIVVFKGDTHLLIPLYAVGVFTAFTLSQSGMVVHWLKEARQKGQTLRRHGWSLLINALGALLCAGILLVIAITKFTHGAWIVLILIPMLVAYFRHVHHYYLRFRDRVEELANAHLAMDEARQVKVILTIGGLSPVIDHSLRMARRISPDVSAVYVAVEPELGEKMKRKWDVRRHGGVQLTVLDSPYRDLVGPLRKYLERLYRANPDSVINLLVPVIVTNEPFDDYLHNSSADLLLRELRFNAGVIITELPFYVNMNADKVGALAYEGSAGDE